MNKKILLLGIVFLLFCSSATAAIDLYRYDHFNDGGAPNSSWTTFGLASADNETSYEGNASIKITAGTGVDEGIETMFSDIDTNTDYVMSFWINLSWGETCSSSNSDDIYFRDAGGALDWRIHLGRKAAGFLTYDSGGENLTGTFSCQSGVTDISNTWGNMQIRIDNSNGGLATIRVGDGTTYTTWFTDLQPPDETYGIKISDFDQGNAFYDTFDLWNYDTYGWENPIISPPDSKAPTWDEIPANQTISTSELFSTDFNATDISGISAYFINDTFNFTIDNTTGILTNLSLLQETNYYINVSVNDTFNNINSTIFWLNVSDDFPSVSIVSPQDGGRNSTNLNVVYTIGSSGTTLNNVTLFLNDTANKTSLNVAVTSNLNISAENMVYGNYTWILQVCDSNLSCINSTERSYFLDDEKPTISVSTHLDNFIVYSDSEFVASINISDPFLYAVNITIDDTIILFNKTNVGNTLYQYNLSFNPRDYGLALGSHTLNVWGADSHTAVKIPDYKYNKNVLSKAITYTFDGGWIKITPLNFGFFSDFNTWKREDRYVFEYKRDALSRLINGNHMEFEISSSDKLDMIVNSEYPGHLVAPSLGNWIDFATSQESTVKMLRVNDKKVTVLVSGIEDDDVIFNSIGGLNVVQTNYSFYYGNVTETYLNQTLETANSLFSINFTRNSSFVSYITASLIFNNTNYLVTPTVTSDYIFFEQIINTELLVKNVTNMTFQWNWTVVTGTGANNVTNTTNLTNQTRDKMLFGNCTNNIIDYSLNFTTKNATSFVNTSIEALFTVWNRTSTLSRSFPFVQGLNHYHAMCISPEWGEFHSDYEIIFSAAEYDNRHYIVANGLLDNSFSNFTIYMDSSADTTAITVTAVDENDNKLGNYFIEVYRYDLGTDSYDLIDTQETNSEGTVVFNLDVSTNQYLFQVKNPSGTLIHTEPKQKLTVTSYTLRIILGTSPESILIKLQQLDYTLSADKTNDNFSLIWDDTITELIDSINLAVYRLNNTGNKTLISSQVSSSASSVLDFNVSGSGVYVAYAYVVATEDGLTYLLDTKSLDIREEWDVFGVDALFSFFLFIGTMFFIGLSSSVAAGEIALATLILGTVVAYILGFIAVTLSGVMSIIITIIFIMVRLKRQ